MMMVMMVLMELRSCDGEVVLLAVDVDQSPSLSRTCEQLRPEDSYA